MGILAALFLLAGTACSITTEDPGYVAPPPLPAIKQLEQAALTDPAAFRPAETSCPSLRRIGTFSASLTSAREEHLNLPYESNSFSDAANNKLATVPVAH
ncbi:hypothetical protein [Pseudarthrobacter sp. S6]|uniref:hypothetical protein n=1 Tax=Pseudarthrobacter sp. S6 TaxID=3418420 RepID=UPI003CE7777F